MKKLLVFLALIIVTAIKAQVYNLNYTAFQLYDQANHKYFEETPVNVTAYVDMDHMSLGIISDGKIPIFMSDILSVNPYAGTIAYKCKEHKTGRMFDIYITTTQENNVLKAKSADESWIYKLPMKK